MKFNEVIAILIAGICLGWLDINGKNELGSQILEAVLALVASTTILGKSFTGNGYDRSAGFIKNLLTAEKTFWPLTILLVGIVVGVLVAQTVRYI